MLKKYVTIIIVILGVATGISISFSMFNQKKEDEIISVSSEQSGLDLPEFSKSNSIARIDYPLIDIYFESSSNYRVEIVDFMNNEIRKEIKEKGDYFQDIKGDFSIKVIPSGMVLSVKLDAPVLCRLDAPELDFACCASADCLHQHLQVI